MADKPRDPRALNAIKGAEPASAQIQIRVTPDRKNRYVEQAQKEGMKLSEWMQKHLDSVCNAAGNLSLKMTTKEKGN